jgi:Ni,Fe-hydrogenase III large subunit
MSVEQRRTRRVDDLLELEALDEGAPGERRVVVPGDGLAPLLQRLLGHGGRLVTAFVRQRPPVTFTVVVALYGELLALVTPPPRGRPAVRAALEDVPAARWLVAELAAREHEARSGTFVRPDPDRFTRRTTGAETFVIPYGPVRSGVFEAIQFIVETGGEDVLALQTRPFFKHRGLESRARGLSVDQGAALAERVAGISSVAHAVAYCQAVERALGVAAPRRAELWRSVHAELERIANHLDVAAKLAEDAALAVGQARFQILKEDVQRLRGDLCGSRFGRRVVVPGGVSAEGRLSETALAVRLGAFERSYQRDRRMLMATTSFTDRLIGSGTLTRSVVERHAAVGPIARASGVPTDARYERPYAGYRRLGWTLATRRSGDAMARLEVRFDEISQSLHLLRQACDRLARVDDGLRSELGQHAGDAFGWAEASQGELVYWVEVDGGAVRDCHIASPSFQNWPLFEECFRGDVLTDFSFDEHSFGLTPAEADR